jgi:hypothetical protein
VIFTGPDGDNFCFTNSNNEINNKVMTKNAATVAVIVPSVLAATIIILEFLL